MNNIIKRTWNQNRMVNIEDLRGMAFQAEDGGHTFEISGINDANEAVSLSGTVAGVFMRPDGTDVALTGTASDGVVSVTLSDACYSVAGRFGLTLFVTADSKKTCVYACIGTVAQSSYGTVAGDTPQDVVDLINAINAAVNSIPADLTSLMAAVAPTYSDTALYAKGSYAWYNGTLYRCTTEIITAESWTAAHWTASEITTVDVYPCVKWINGAIGSTGSDSGSYTNLTRIRTQKFIKIPVSSYTVIVPDGYRAVVHTYNSSEVWQSKTGTLNPNTYTYSITPGWLIRVAVFNAAQTNISPLEDWDKVKIYYPETFTLLDNDENSRPEENATLSMFQTIGVIGDSWASGSLYDPVTGNWVVTNYDLSWGQIIGREDGIDVTNFSHGGLSTASWLTHADGLTKLLSTDPQNLYLICLGINDNTAISGGTETLGTIEDVNVSDYTQNPDTFFGNYGKIIGNILNYAPHAKIVCMSIPRLGERNMDQYIKQIASKYGIPYLQLTDDAWFTSQLFYSSVVNGHPLSYGQAGIAQATRRLLRKCIINNLCYWQDYRGEV